MERRIMDEPSADRWGAATARLCGLHDVIAHHPALTLYRDALACIVEGDRMMERLDHLVANF